MLEVQYETVVNSIMLLCYLLRSFYLFFVQFLAEKKLQ